MGYLLDNFCGCKNLSAYRFVHAQESRSNLWVRYQNQLNSRWPRFNPDKELNSEYIQIPDIFMKSGKFRLTRSEFLLLKNQIEASNKTMSHLLGKEFIAGLDDFSNELSQQELLDLMIDLAKLSV